VSAVEVLDIVKKDGRRQKLTVSVDEHEYRDLGAIGGTLNIQPPIPNLRPQ
jgi:hypothetical protein